MLSGLYGTSQLPSPNVYHTAPAPQFSSAVPLYSTASVVAAPTIPSFPASSIASAPLYVASPSYDKNPSDSYTLELVRILSSAHPYLGTKYPSPKQGVFISNLSTTVTHEKDKVTYEYTATYPTETPEKNEPTKFAQGIVQPIIPAGFEPGDLKYDAKVDDKAKTYKAIYTISFKRIKL